MMLLRTHTFTGLLAFVTLAMAPSQVHAQGTFEDCSDSNTFTSIATTGTLLTDISTDTSDRQEVTLPFDFPWINGNSYSSVSVRDDVFLVVGGTDEIIVAGNSRADATNVYYQENGINSVVISWEDYKYGGAEQNSNVQATLFSNGDITFCYGSGDTNGASIFSFLTKVPGDFVPVDVAPFASSGISDTWPTNNLCVCYESDSGTTLFPTDEPTRQPSVSPSATPSAQPSFSPSAQPSVSPSSSPSAQPTISNEPTITECLSRSTKSPGKGKGGKGMKMRKTTKTAAPTGCFQTKAPGKGMMMGGKGMKRKGRGKGMMMG